MKKIINLTLLLLIVATVSAKREKTAEPDQAFDVIKHLEVYGSALRELELNYVDTLKHDKLLEMSLDRMLYGLDPYTTFIPSSNEELLKTMRSGQYGGIGSVITLVDGKPYIADPYYGMPAQVNGLQAGDEIIEIDGEKCAGKKLSEVSSMLRGKPYTTINIKIKRLGHKKLIKKSFLRDIIQMETVPYYQKVSDGIGYIVILDFIDRTSEDFEKALKDLVESQGAEKIIVDLRGNGGGLVNEAVDIATLFVPKGTEIVRMKSRDAKDNYNYVTLREPKYPDLPLLFLVDENTASSSEILSGAMQDLDRALIMGERTFGKGLVQSVRQLPYDNYLKITTAKYYLPSGRCVQAIDYANRQNGDRDRAVPDSLTKEFKTTKGRIVRDGGGVMPDSVIKEDVSYNISHYMLVKNLYFKYANRYVTKHETIPSPLEFALTDEEYSEFCEFVIASGFTYRLESEKYLEELHEVIKMEGYDELTSEIFEQLKNSLQPNVKNDLVRFKKDIKHMLESEIIKRYYYQKGCIEYETKTDKWLKKAIETLNKKDIL